MSQRELTALATIQFELGLGLGLGLRLGLDSSQGCGRKLGSLLNQPELYSRRLRDHRRRPLDAVPRCIEAQMVVQRR
jgi:hypothetical protein